MFLKIQTRDKELIVPVVGIVILIVFLVYRFPDPLESCIIHARITSAPDALDGIDFRKGEFAVREVPRTCKLFGDARGWAAHIHDDTLFLRVFPDLAPSQAAPRQAEVELFFGLERDYIELENQGAYEVLAPGAALTYPVRWRFTRLDPRLPDDRVTPELVAVIEALLAAR